MDGYGDGGQHLERPNVCRMIDIEITKDALFDFFILQFIFNFFKFVSIIRPLKLYNNSLSSKFLEFW